ncbi:hypothetical protein HOLleu_42662 [Holothuria leucospilota]|uniref:Uncharacterized protein n=1 Tax=Holothuria leucospilota TaxID=206669 RepID=A0A9Q0YBF5_HOLLE|nr:hypothetical protein HOLleu_42662 [Holothuria leucospilota]
MVYFVHYRPIYQRLWHSQLNPSAWRYIPNSLPLSSVSWHTSSQNLSYPNTSLLTYKIAYVTCVTLTLHT